MFDGDNKHPQIIYRDELPPNVVPMKPNLISFSETYHPIESQVIINLLEWGCIVGYLIASNTPVFVKSQI